jgi:hypothetical protein
MGEYGRVVGEGTGLGGRGGGSNDLAGQVMAAMSDLVDRIASLPPEVLVSAAVVILIGGWLLIRR